jgi:hypothetical protein
VNFKKRLPNGNRFLFFRFQLQIFHFEEQEIYSSSALLQKINLNKPQLIMNKIISTFITCFALISTVTFAQTGTIKGTIKTSDGVPAEFVNIGLKGTSQGTTANSKGEYEIKKVNAGNYILITSFVGLETKELEIAVKIGGTPKEGGIVSIQNELSPRYRHDIDVLEVCEKYGIAFLPWSPLGGAKNKGELSTGQSIFETIAEQRSVSPFVVALSWLLKLSPVIIPIPGATRAESATDSASAAGFELSDAEFEKIQSSLPESAPISSELTPHPPLRS